MKKVISALIITLGIVNCLPTTTVQGYRLPGQIITWDTGKVTDHEGNGYATTPGSNPEFNYIQYSQGHEGEKVTTVFFYNPFTLWADDIYGRWDFYRF